MTRRNRDFILGLAALALGGAQFALAFNNRNSENTAAQILLQHREAQLAIREANLNKREADLMQRQVDFLKSKLDDIKNDNVFDFVTDRFDSVWNFIISLDLFQLAAILNILVLILIMLALVNIFLVYLSDFYIAKFQLETRYPKLARLFKARQTIVKANIALFTISLPFVFIYGFVINFAILYCYYV